MNDKEKTSLGKFISKILRHHPEIIGITLDEHGWADVPDLISGIQANGHPDFIWQPLKKSLKPITNNATLSVMTNG